MHRFREFVHQQTKTILDSHDWPVHKDEVEDDKCAPINGNAFLHKLNQNLIQWEHDYFYS